MQDKVMNDFQIYSKESIHHLSWPSTEHGKRVKAFFLPLIQEGVHHFIENVKTCVYIISYKDWLIPITVNEKEYDNAYVTSNYVCIQYLKQKLSKNLKYISPIFDSFGFSLKLAKINKVVMVNNWLMTTSIHETLSHIEVKALTDFLSHTFNDHYIMWRSLHQYRDPHTITRLEASHYNIIPSRHIYFFNPDNHTNLPKRARRHLKQDKELFENSGYHLLKKEDLQEEHFTRLQELYIKIYVDKYKTLSPLFNHKFLQNLKEMENVQFICLKKERIDGFCVLFKTQEEMTMAFMGHDTTLALSEGVYRMINYLAINEAIKEGLLFNQSSGADQFKLWRGAEVAPEFVAVYDKHLSIFRRILFTSSATFVKWFHKKKSKGNF